MKYLIASLCKVLFLVGINCLSVGVFVEGESLHFQKGEGVEESPLDSCCISIGSVGLCSKFYVGDHSQESVDAHDIVFAKDIYDYNGTIRFLGHNTRSFATLCNVLVGDLICVTDKSGNVYEFKVVKSEKGYLSGDRLDVFSSVTNERLTNAGYVEFITCYGDVGGRWVVLCEKT